MKNTCLLLIAMLISACSSNKEGCSRTQASAPIVSEAHEDVAAVHYPMAGGYSEEREVKQEDQELFLKAYDGEKKLTPLRVAIQVVAGINYRFFCQDDDNKLYEVIIYQPLRGAASLTSAREIK